MEKVAEIGENEMKLNVWWQQYEPEIVEEVKSYHLYAGFHSFCC
jgi:hypothetical protein